MYIYIYIYINTYIHTRQAMPSSSSRRARKGEKGERGREGEGARGKGRVQWERWRRGSHVFVVFVKRSGWASKDALRRNRQTTGAAVGEGILRLGQREELARHAVLGKSKKLHVLHQIWHVRNACERMPRAILYIYIYIYIIYIHICVYISLYILYYIC